MGSEMCIRDRKSTVPAIIVSNLKWFAVEACGSHKKDHVSPAIVQSIPSVLRTATLRANRASVSRIVIDISNHALGNLVVVAVVMHAASTCMMDITSSQNIVGTAHVVARQDVSEETVALASVIHVSHVAVFDDTVEGVIHVHATTKKP